MSLQVSLVVSAALFAAFLVFKMRPHFGEDGRARSQALRAARERILAAADDHARAMALADAGDACASLGRYGAAASYYQRALRSEPTSASIVPRLTTALAPRPRLLENLLYRHLAHGSASAEGRDAMVACLRALVALYGRSPRTEPRRRGLENVLEALGARPAAST